MYYGNRICHSETDSVKKIVIFRFICCALKQTAFVAAGLNCWVWILECRVEKKRHAIGKKKLKQQVFV